MKRLRQIAKGIFSKPEEAYSSNGLSVSVEELAEMRRFVPYLRRMHNRRSFSHQAGEVKSAFKGRGMELEEIRAYTFGDDVRDMDWRVTARKQSPYTKLYSEEKDREIYVWLDLSPQMIFGTRRELKSVAASKIAALLGWMALENKDRFGCVIFDGEASLLFKPQNNRRQLTAVFNKISRLSREVLQNKTDSEESRRKSLKLLEQSVKNQAAVFILSGFNSFDEGERKRLAALAKKTRLYLVDVFDVLEEIAPKAGEYMAAYAGRQLVIDSSSKAYRREYKDYFADKRQNLRDFCRKFRCQLLEFRTDMELVNNLKIW